MLVALTFCKLRQLVSKRDPRSPLINHPRVRKRAKNPRLFLPFFFFFFFSYLPNSCKIHRSDAVNYSHGTNYHRLYNNHQVALPRLEIRISRESTINDNIALPPRLNCFFFFFVLSSTINPSSNEGSKDCFRFETNGGKVFFSFSDNKIQHSSKRV